MWSVNLIACQFAGDGDTDLDQAIIILNRLLGNAVKACPICCELVKTSICSEMALEISPPTHPSLRFISDIQSDFNSHANYLTYSP
jgi:hypothetical protein